MLVASRPRRVFHEFVRVSAAWLLRAALLVSVVHPVARAQEVGDDARWVATWATAAVARPQAPLTENGSSVTAGSQDGRGNGRRVFPVVHDRTLRQIVRTSVGGDHVRVVFSNVFGTAPLVIGGSHIALRDSAATIVPGLGAPITFSGNRHVRIPPGAVVVSDPVDLAVPPLADLAIDLYLPADGLPTTSPLTMHGGARQTNYVSVSGDITGATEMPQAETIESWFFLARVEVIPAEQPARVIVALGDSITDGYNSTPDANSRWPDHLARRLLAHSDAASVSVLNVGIDGNRVLESGLGISALARFDRDVLVQTGATHVIVLEGINDLGLTGGMPRPSAADLIAGHRQLIARGRAQGLGIIGATLLPFEGAAFDGYWSPEGEATRQQVNEWIRTGGEYDGVIDFDAALRDPAHPTRLLPQHDSGDHLHPSDAGYKAMAEAVDLALFDFDR